MLAKLKPLCWQNFGYNCWNHPAIAKIVFVAGKRYSPRGDEADNARCFQRRDHVYCRATCGTWPKGKLVELAFTIGFE